MATCRRQALSGLRLLAVLWLWPGAAARAGEGAWYDLRIDACVRVRPGLVGRLVGLELGPALRDRPRAAAGPMLLRASCDGDVVIVHLADPATGQSMDSTVDLAAQAPGLRQRFLAVAIAELLAAAASGPGPAPGPPQAPPQAPKEPEPPPAQAAQVQAAPLPRKPMLPTELRPAKVAATKVVRVPVRRQRQLLRVLALGSGQMFPNGQLYLWGGGVEVAGDAAHHLGWSGDVIARHGIAEFGLGAVVVDTLSVGAALLGHGDIRGLRLRGGAGVRGGMVRLHGEPADPQQADGGTFYGGWAAPVLCLSASYAPARRLVLQAAIEGGYVVLPVTGRVAGMPAVTVGGPLVGMDLGLGIFP